MTTLTSNSPNDATDEGVAILLETLTKTLSKLVGTLRKPTVQTELALKLHDADILPDKHIESLAANAVDLLEEAKHMLQPTQLVLADHFMGLCLTLRVEPTCSADFNGHSVVGLGYYLSSKCLVAAVSLKIPDILSSSTSMTVSELAVAAGAHEDRLRPVMRLLFNKGIFTYDDMNDSYANNGCSELLRTNHWTQWHTWVDLYATEFYDMARGIPACLFSDATRTAAQINYDTDD